MCTKMASSTSLVQVKCLYRDRKHSTTRSSWLLGIWELSHIEYVTFSLLKGELQRFRTALSWSWDIFFLKSNHSKSSRSWFLVSIRVWPIYWLATVGPKVFLYTVYLVSRRMLVEQYQNLFTPISVLGLAPPKIVFVG